MRAMLGWASRDAREALRTEWLMAECVVRHALRVFRMPFVALLGGGRRCIARRRPDATRRSVGHVFRPPWRVEELVMRAQ